MVKLLALCIDISGGVGEDVIGTMTGSAPSVPSPMTGGAFNISIKLPPVSILGTQIMNTATYTPKMGIAIQRNSSSAL